MKKPRFGDVLQLHKERSQQADETTTEQTEKPTDQKTSKPTKRRASKPRSQQVSKSANKQIGKSAKRKASKPAPNPEEETAGIGGRVPLSWRNHWVGEARKQGTTVIEVIIEAMTERFGLPKK